MADKICTLATHYHRGGTIAANRAVLTTAGKPDMQRVFTKRLANRLTKTRVENQMDNVSPGLDQIPTG